MAVEINRLSDSVDSFKMNLEENEGFCDHIIAKQIFIATSFQRLLVISRSRRERGRNSTVTQSEKE